MSPDTAIYVLELVGLFAFATSGALMAIRSDFDVVGIVVLAETTALGGGVLRDVIIGAHPPAAFRDPLYLVIPLVAAAVTFFFHPQVARLGIAVLIFDAGGLGLYTVTGTVKALDAGLGMLQAVILGVTTAVGGGVLRDVLARQTPELFQTKSELYAVPSAIGAIIVAVAYQSGWLLPAAAAGAAVFVSSFRLLALWRGWRAPGAWAVRR
ncbi:trimeric intracellular cation channel family protein [Actinoplanes flavus]|uniref:Trimeric intracellular cation channel family protein n=1 Tax=Actinoplanes flavus TaxID=2820290 RepID=A0ABS3UUI5_9ACTN|nr:trimeric intracellular cation channel family protein [Actinoplanes flavus]MBO3742253.1 trimeric intracellular cation channel family protein [Actinoplanes flavus]